MRDGRTLPMLGLLRHGQGDDLGGGGRRHESGTHSRNGYAGNLVARTRGD